NDNDNDRNAQIHRTERSSSRGSVPGRGVQVWAFGVSRRNSVAHVEVSPSKGQLAGRTQLSTRRGWENHCALRDLPGEFSSSKWNPCQKPDDDGLGCRPFISRGGQSAVP